MQKETNTAKPKVKKAKYIDGRSKEQSRKDGGKASSAKSSKSSTNKGSKQNKDLPVYNDKLWRPILFRKAASLINQNFQ